MAETSYPIAGGAGVTDNPYENLMNHIMSIGRVHPTLDYITAATDLVYGDSTGRQVKVAANSAYIVRGFRWESGTDVAVLALAANTSGKTRIDRVVLRLDRSTYTVRLAVLTGTAADSPAPPAVTQSSTSTGVYEVPLAQVTVTSNTGAGLPSIIAANVKPEHNYLMPHGLNGLAANRGGALPLGRLYHEMDTSRLYMGSSAGDLLIGENGPNTKVAAAGGWTSDSIYVQRVNGRTHFQCSIKLNVADRPASTDLVVCNLSASFRPQHNIAALCGMAPGQVGFVLFDATSGSVTVTAYPQTFPNAGTLIIQPFSWPSVGLAQ